MLPLAIKKGLNKMIPIKKQFYATIYILVLSALGYGQVYNPGDVYYGRNNYITYYPGDLALIFSAGHGGALTPGEIPDRTYGTTVTDSKTKETALAIRDAVYEFTGRYPHVIISNLKRTKLDPNREIVEAAQGNQWAEQAWNEYHDFIEIAKDSVTKQHGKGFYVDVHGHGHSIKRLELGYLLSATDLNKLDSQLNGQTYINKSSVRALGTESPDSFSEVIRGPESIGTLFEDRGIPAIPSTNQPNPGSGNPYFTGGYSTKRHGSRDGGTVSGLQIEAHYSGIRNSASNRANYAAVMTEVLDIYFREHFGWDGIVSDIQENPQVLPDYILHQNYPNPFNPITVISYRLPVPGFITLKVYDMLGQEVKVLVNSKQSAGVQSVVFNAADLPSGVYFYTLAAENGFSQTKKLILIR